MKNKNSKGITLVALVITIILLLIIAGISIVELAEKGLFEKTKLAKEKQNNAQNKENQILQEYENSVESTESVSSNRENEKSYFLKVYKDDVLCEDIPSKDEGYIPNEITCTNGAKASFDINNWKLTISEITTKNVVCTMKFIFVGNNQTNLNQTNLKSFSADDSWDGCIPKNAIDGSMQDGRYRNWYGGTKLLIEYNKLSLITHMAVYTTNNWGNSFSNATIYYSQDDSLTLQSNLNEFKSINLKTESKQFLEQVIQAKRIMLVKEETGAVYEFECYGTFSK